MESALEHVDFISQKKNKVKKSQKKRNKHLKRTLLDASIHHHLMQGLFEKEKRGRPDIIHSALLMALGSRLNQEGHLQIYVHTRNDEIITFNPEVRIPRNYNRFVGLMTQLFEIKAIPPNSEQPLISIKSQSLGDLLNTIYPDLVILFTEYGILKSGVELQKIFLEKKRMVCLIGGFAHGDFSQKVLDLADMKLSIYSKLLSTLVVVSTVIQIAEQSFKIS